MKTVTLLNIISRIFFTILVFVSVKLYLDNAEFSGVCDKNANVYTKNELVEKVINQIISVSAQSDSLYHYESIEDFLLKNPDCCIFYNWNDPKTTSIFSQKIFRRILSTYIYQVDVNYKKNNEKEALDRVSINSCGDILEAKEFESEDSRSNHLLDKHLIISDQYSR